jgi:hypothetical protein
LLFNRHLMMKLYYTESMDMVVLRGHGYRAAGDSQAFASFSDNARVLTVKAQNLDNIAEVCNTEVTEVRDDDFMNHVFDVFVQSKFIPENTRQIEADRRTQAIDSQNESIVVTTITGGGKAKHDSRAPTMRNIMRQRRLFISQNGHIGIGPKNVQPNDIVFIISGSSVSSSWHNILPNVSTRRWNMIIISNVPRP